MCIYKKNKFTIITTVVDRCAVYNTGEKWCQMCQSKVLFQCLQRITTVKL